MTELIWPTAKDAIAHTVHAYRFPLKWNPTDHLLSRLAFGPTAAHRSYVAKHGPDAWYSAQLRASRAKPGYNGNSDVSAVGTLLSLSPWAVRRVVEDTGVSAWLAMDQLSRVTLGLQAWSSAPLYEVLVDFFSNHLHVQNHNGDLWNTRHTFDRDVIRKYALGSFTDMLLGSAKNPAMLQYLSLAASTDAQVNENYGRELLELHTVGLNYTESDVVNTAKLLTGRTLDAYDHYVFDDYIHPTGRVQVLGFSHPNMDAMQGEAAGDALLTYLAEHPLTAAHLAYKLCVRLVSDAPSDALVSAVADAYLDNGTQILPMVSTIFRSTEFWHSRGAKVRRPRENLIAAIRLLGLKAADYPASLATLHWATHLIGDLPLEWPAPNGYPDVASAWHSAETLTLLWNYHIGLAGQWGGFPRFAPESLYGTATTSGAAIRNVTHTLTGTAWTAPHLAVLQSFLGEPASTPLVKSNLRALGQPLVAIVLDSPYHAFR